MVRGCSWGVPTKKISRLVLLLTHKWAHLMACTVDVMERVLSTLLRWTPRTCGTTGLTDEFSAYAKNINSKHKKFNIIAIETNEPEKRNANSFSSSSGGPTSTV